MPIIQIWLIQRANITNWPGVDRMETLKGIARFSEHSGVQSKVFQIIRSWMGCFSARSARYSQSGEVVSETECKTGNGTYHEVSTSYLPTKESPLPCSKQYSYDIRRRVHWRRPQLMLCGRWKGIHGFVTPIRKIKTTTRLCVKTGPRATRLEGRTRVTPTANNFLFSTNRQF